MTKHESTLAIHPSWLPLARKAIAKHDIDCEIQESDNLTLIVFSEPSRGKPHFLWHEMLIMHDYITSDMPPSVQKIFDTL